MRLLLRFLGSERANVAIIFGLLATPILALVGAGIDYALAARDRGALQEAIDAGALAGSRLLGIQSDANARAQAEAIVRANLPPRLSTVPLTIDIVNGGQSLRISTSATVTTSMLQIIGQGSIDVAATTTAMAPAYREIELVLALDNTGSMASAGKMTALKEATLELLRLLETSGRRPGDVRVGIVPFDRMVRVGTGYANASWIRNVPSNWTGCVWDRDSPYNTNDTAPVSGTNATRFPAQNCPSTSLATIQPLTTDFTALRNTVNAMTPSGNTNVTIGFAWGWHLLSGNEPFTQTQTTSETNIDRWLVVLTDGQNTQDRWSTSQSTIDGRTRTVCDNLRAQDTTIRVMTVRVIDGNAALLRACASNENYYYHVSDASQLIDVFRRIAWEITSLRLTN
jgi:Flp pilus assembly protein TadG